MRTLPPLHRLSLALLVLAMSACFMPTASADEAMPSVVGQSEADALRQLEALGLDVRVVTVAEASPGRVASQEPTAGARVESGDEATLRVGVLVRILTRVPRVAGLTERRAVEGLSEAYDLDVRYVEGPRHLQGRVQSQEPRAGSELLFRGVLRLDIVRNRIAVPTLVGMSEGDAAQALEAAGLGVHIRYVETRSGRRGTVLGQSPRPGARLEVGDVVELQVAGKRGRPGARHVRVPDVTGLNMYEAEEELLNRGLTPHVHIVKPRSSVLPWTVVGQEVPAGKRVKQGAHVGLDVAAPGNSGERVRIPALHGQHIDEVRGLLTHMGLRVELGRAPSNHPPGTILRQSPRAGTFLPAGGLLRLAVATQPRFGWTAPVVAVPNLKGLSPARARLTLLEAGFVPVLRRDLGPDRPLDQVFRQRPKAGSRQQQGSEVAYMVPFKASVPEIRKLTREQALVTLQRAGLQGLARQSGPMIPGGVSQVYRQGAEPGRVIARGSLIEFRFRLVPARNPLRVVPNIVGMTRDNAAAKLRSVGFEPVLVAASAGTGTTKVVGQTPIAGARVPVGQRITATYRFINQSLPPYVTVPRVIGLSQEEARRRLESLGFAVRGTRAGPVTLGATRVIAQNPIGGTNRPRGSTITITYRMTPPSGQVVLVPDLIGKRFDQAFDALRRAGLAAKFSGIGSRVIRQSPAPGSAVAPGSKVSVSLK